MLSLLAQRHLLAQPDDARPVHVLEILLPERPDDGDLQAGERRRLGQECERSEVEGAANDILVIRPGEHQRRRPLVRREAADQVDAALPRQTQVRDEQVDGCGREKVARLVRARGQRDLEPEPAEAALDERADGQIVLDDENTAPGRLDVLVSEVFSDGKRSSQRPVIGYRRRTTSDRTFWGVGVPQNVSDTKDSR